uniref:Uncharacterized protein n=1 Tax=Globodera rostochiensis TaxID=31243 RepID=A0A914HMG9_GLORO
MHSHKFNQNLFGYLTFVVLLVFICQTTARKQSQKDLTKTGQEMLASAQTLLHGKKTPKTEGQKDPIKTGQELLDSAPTLFDGMKSGSFDDGKSMEEAAKNVESAALKVMQNLDKPKILQNIHQKIAENTFLDEEIKVKMTTLLGQFKIGIDKFNAIKIVYNQHENGLLRQRRRRKRADPTHGHDHDDKEDEDDDDEDDDADEVEEMEEGKPKTGRKANIAVIIKSVQVRKAGPVVATIKSEKVRKFGPVVICMIVLVIMLVAFAGLTVIQSGQPLQPLFTGVSIVVFLLLLCLGAGYYSLMD